MELQTRTIGTATVVEVVGRLDARTYDLLKQTWQKEPAVKYFIVDLSQTEFIDSVGLATLVSGLKTARLQGGDLVLVNPTQAVRTILDLTSMNRVFRVVPHLEEALTSIGITQ